MRLSAIVGQLNCFTSLQLHYPALINANDGDGRPRGTFTSWNDMVNEASKKQQEEEDGGSKKWWYRIESLPAQIWSSVSRHKMLGKFAFFFYVATMRHPSSNQHQHHPWSHGIGADSIGRSDDDGYDQSSSAVSSLYQCHDWPNFVGVGGNNIASCLQLRRRRRRARTIREILQ